MSQKKEKVAEAATEEKVVTEEPKKEEPKAAPKKEEPKAAKPAKAEKPVQPAPVPAKPVRTNRIPLRTFLRLTGLKFDQLAGFRYYAEKNYPQPRSRTEWKKLLDDFMQKPVN